MRSAVPSGLLNDRVIEFLGLVGDGQSVEEVLVLLHPVGVRVFFRDFLRSIVSHFYKNLFIFYFIRGFYIRSVDKGYRFYL